ncbi:MAG: YggS family pyridoxal phosphate-dependent enzyme, partial [Planctomycetaceae bacterium]
LAVKHAAVIHSVDSLRLLERLNVLAQESNRTLQVLLQVNVAGEASKSGFDPGSLPESWEAIVKSAGTRLKLIGLMTMAPQSDSPEAARPVFAELAALRQQLNVRSGRAELTELSMGMSSDFEVAIEEGATLIRIGSSLFDGLEAEDQ